MKFILQLLLIIFITSCQTESNHKPLINIDLSKDIVKPKHYVVSKTTETIFVDGKANDSAWGNAIYSELFIDIEGDKKPYYDTKMKMLWDDQYLYIFAELKEDHVWGDITQRDAVIFYNNDFEVFIDPMGYGENYGEIEINALGTIWELMLTKPYRVGGKPINSWNIDGLKSAVHVEGTINDPRDIDSLWSVEMAIPLETLVELKDKPKFFPKDGEQWRINFSRVQWEHEIIEDQYQRKKIDGQYISEYNWVWSPQKVINMHEPEKWGYLQFSESKDTKDIQFNRTNDELEQQVAYALFRSIRYGKLKDLLQLETGSHQELQIENGTVDKLKADFHKTNFGFEIIIKGLKNNKSFMINEVGYLKEIA